MSIFQLSKELVLRVAYRSADVLRVLKNSQESYDPVLRAFAFASYSYPVLLLVHWCRYGPVMLIVFRSRALFHTGQDAPRTVL